MFKRGFLIELDKIPKTSLDICLEVANYCGKNSLNYEFLNRTEPILVLIEGVKYEVKKSYQTVRYANCFVLSCREVE